MRLLRFTPALWLLLCGLMFGTVHAAQPSPGAPVRDQWYLESSGLATAPSLALRPLSIATWPPVRDQWYLE
jgi:hypothetical protein